MNSHEEIPDVAMLESNDTIPEQKNQGKESTKAPPVAENSGSHHHGATAASKELRIQQQDDDDDEEEEVAVEAVVADEDDDGDAVMAAVVVNEDEEDDVPIAELSSTPIKSNTTPPASSKSNKAKGNKRKSQRVPQDRLTAASEARAILADTVTRLPILVSDTHVVRSFGRIQVEASNEGESKYSSASALHPVGFSCDRYEFSPVHGRVLKMRCTIFDGKKLKEKQLERGMPPSDLPDGPIFRVMWGQGVDEDVDIVDYPYDVFTDSAPLVDDSKVDTVAVPLSGKDLSEMEPEAGMRVRVRFEHDAWFSGTIVSFSEGEYDKKKKQPVYNIRIHYDDGTIEDTVFPDPDISIYLPGSEDGSMENGIVEIDELRGKPVTSVIGTSPIQAWGNALIKLGLIDEIMMQSALDARGVAQVEGRAEAQEKMEEKKAKRQQAQARIQQRQAVATDEKADDPTEKKETKPAGNPKDDEESKEPQMNGSVSKEKDVSEAKAVADGNHGEAATSLPASIADNEAADKTEVSNNDVQPEQQVETSKAGEVLETKEAEPASEAEAELRRQVQQLQQDMTSLQAEDRESSIALADARISTLGPLFINPFHEQGPTLTQQAQWLTTVVRKEKTKMGSTGNKKKIVTATDLLERNDTFFNADIEALVEGLPGSEYCPSYVFRAFRGGGASAVSQAWVHEAKLRQEREREKQSKSASQANTDVSDFEKDKKRKRRDGERDARKRQKKGEMDEKKRARAEERMSRLNIQVDDRLFKEACFQREKVIQLLSKSLGKDFAMRRKAAELVSAQLIAEGRRKHDIPRDTLPQEMPSLGRVYDEDVVRVWDFFTTFGSIFLERGYLPNIPSLDALQDAIDSLRGKAGVQKSRSDAIDQLVQTAIALCHPLAATVTRYLFASLIALNPALQKDFGAAFFNEVNASANANDDAGTSSANGVLPLNTMTWQEVARLTFLSDSLGEIGYSRQDSAHLIRGYRSGGHPSSKESKRLRRSEDYTIGLLRQELAERELHESPMVEEVSGDYKVRVNVPSRPSASQDQWTFYLHNVKSLPPDSVNLMRENIQKAIASLEATASKPPDSKTFLTDLGRSLEMLADVKSSKELSETDVQSCKKAREIVLRVLDRVSGEVYSSDVIGSVVHKDDITNVASKSAAGESVVTVSSNRQRMGLLNSLALSDTEFKKFGQGRGDYMADALRLKEKLNEAEDEEEDDDDDDDDDDSNNGNEDADGKDVASSDSKKPDDDDGTPKPVSAYTENGKAAAAEDSTEVVATVVENGESKSDSGETPATGKSDKNDVVVTVVEKNPFEEFCGDVPGAPELLRRCLAVLRTLCQTGSAEPFLFPVDPQSNPGYYEVILRPMCFREVGMRLRDAASLCMGQSPSGATGEDVMQKDLVESIVAQFARNVRLIGQNSACYVNAGAMVVCAGEEMIRIFERLFFDWVLAPKKHRPPLDSLDDDRCVEHHPSDEDSLVLLCDGCEGKYNMSRLDPPITQVPKGNWYCPRCVSGRCWETLDPRIGKTVNAKDFETTNDASEPECSGVIRRCVLGRPEGHNVKATLLYEVGLPKEKLEIWTLSEVDEALAAAGQPVEPIACVEAVAESPGYGIGTERGVFNDLVPVPLNPRVSYTAGEAAVSSTVYRDTIAGASAFRLISPEEMTAHEWLRLLILLITKCSASELMQTLVSKMESEAAEKMATLLENTGKVKKVHEVLPRISDDEGDEAEATGVASGVAADGNPVESNDTVKIVKAESVEEVDATAMVVDASAVEVVADVEMEPVVVAEQIPSSATTDEASSRVEATKAKRVAAFTEKEKRMKAREDSIAAFCIKNELRPAVASFEEDVVSQVVDSTLATKDKGLTLQNCRCRGMVCDFCGLSDVALGSPLVRAPSSEEWDDLMPHAARSRRTTLLAALPGKKKLAAVTIRLGGEIISDKPEPHLFDNIADGGMTELLPRNEKGFQHELKFRDEYDLPFVTGSLSAHECCAVAVHNTRKECVLREHAEKEAYLVEWETGMACGRTLSLGRDANGRSYWKFKGDSSLFVCANETIMNGDMVPRKLWYKITTPEEIASLLYFLGADRIAPELRRAFPVAARMLKTRKWTELLLKRRFPLQSKPILADTPVDASAHQERPKEDNDEQPYEEKEGVLVESRNGKLLWNATIVGVSQTKETGKVNGYRVHYDEWSSRFDEWVDPFRVVEQVENNIEVQAEMLEDAASLRDGVPPELDNMIAKKFLRAKDRARGLAALPNFADAARVEPTASTGKRTLGMLKAALLLLEAALPSGAVDTSSKGPWRPSLAALWRNAVRSARGPASLMRCLVLLESSLSLEWVDPHYSHLLSCLPIGWKAINEATVGSIALRIFVIDRGVHFEG